MAPLHSSLLLRPQPHPFFLPNPNPNLITRYPLLPLRLVKLKTSLPHSSTDSDTNQTSSAAPRPTKKSFAVATADMLLGLASRIIKRRNEGTAAASVAMFERSGKFSDERIGKVIEDEIQPGVVWEQRVKDVEAEKERRVITSPGFSFSAAGLLFPYHLGAAQFLIENAYIKETTPLAMFDPVWEVRHGGVMALREILTHQGASAGVFMPDLSLDDALFVDLESKWTSETMKRSREIDLNVQVPIDESGTVVKKPKFDDVSCPLETIVSASKDGNIDISVQVEDGGCNLPSQHVNGQLCVSSLKVEPELCPCEQSVSTTEMKCEAFLSRCHCLCSDCLRSKHGRGLTSY